MSAYQPGLGAVTRGEPDLVKSAFRQVSVMQRTLQLVGIGLTLVMGVLYGMLWLLRRSRGLVWLVQPVLAVLGGLSRTTSSQLEAWPFASTDAFQRANHIAMLASIVCFFMFALHFCQLAARRLRRVCRCFWGPASRRCC